LLTLARRGRYRVGMRISFSTGTLYYRGLAYTLALAREAGFDGVELVVGPDYALGGAPRVARIARGAGLPILSIHPPFTRFPRWPRPVGLRVLRLVELARAVESRVLVLHAPLIWNEQTPRAQRYTDALRLGQAAADGSGLAIGIESIQYNKRSERYHLDDLQALAHFATERGCGITLDTCHVGANGEDLLAAYAIARPALVNVHLSDVEWRDGHAKTHRPPGTGALPLRELLGQMARDGYDGLVTVELHPRYVPLVGRGRQLAALRRSATFVREAIATAAPMDHGLPRATAGG